MYLSDEKKREVREMKKIFDRRILIKLDSWKNFKDTSILRHLRYEEESFAGQNFSCRLDTFKEAKNAIEKGLFFNAESTTTFFTKKPLLRINASTFDSPIIMTEKDFEPIEVKIIYEEEKNLSIGTIADLLNADSFCEYLRDRNISSIKF